MFQLGLLGAGNMGGAILRGIMERGVIESANVTVYDSMTEKMEQVQSAYGVQIASSAEEMIRVSDMVLLAIKPSVCESFFSKYRAQFSDKAVLSIIAGWSQARLSESLPSDVRILRIMPNMPAMVGEGMIVFEKGDTLTDEEHAFAKKLLSAVGKVLTVDGKLMDAVTAVSGSGPAYAFMFMEAMADGAVKEGLPRDIAYTLSAQTLYGAAKMLLETGEHPGALKDRVCSPGGTTIDAVASLERDGFRSAVIRAEQICCEKSRNMSIDK